ncbi:MAG TPA: enoyl-CoA hydratase/isomerase family protein [Solirubrobacterales bacterium]|nr:enoyl-CoA hydratase/isomerase family protein [Solirubrobacterales bacterium]
MSQASQSFEKIRYTSGDHIATITLDDPETRNALSEQMLGELISALHVARTDDDVRVVVLASSHEKVFSAGGNLAAFGGDANAVQKFEGAENFVEAFKLLGQLGKPSIVAARGHVLAGSLGLALACDLILASEEATFGTPEITVGLFPFMIMALIYRNVGRKKTNEMLMLGERLTAEEARQEGIVNKVVPAKLFDVQVDEWAKMLAAKSPLIMKLGKDAMWRQMDMDLAAALDYLRSQLAIELSSEDAIEGVKAFFEKREPEWKGR